MCTISLGNLSPRLLVGSLESNSMRLYQMFVSQVRSATLDTWLPEQVSFIQCKLLLNTLAQIFCSTSVQDWEK